MPGFASRLQHGLTGPLEEAMTVKDILRERGWTAITIDGEAPVSAVIRVMRREGVTALAVSGNGRHVNGLITEREIMRTMRLTCVEGLMDMPAHTIMSLSVTTCRPEEDLRRVMARLAARCARHAVVVDEYAIRGVVSIADIIEHRLLEAEREIEMASNLYLIAS